MERRLTLPVYSNTNGVSLPLDENRKPPSHSRDPSDPRSPRAPPLISKFRGEPPPARTPPPTQPSGSRYKNQGIFFASTGRTTASRAPFYIIHPEWASEKEAVCKLGTKSGSQTLPARAVSSRGRRKQVGIVNGGEPSHGILPEDKGAESILSVARKAAAHNPVWPHRCKSAPAKRSRNPIAWV